MRNAALLLEFCIHRVNDGEKVARPLPPQTHLVFPQIGLKFRQIHISVTAGIHFTEHSLNLHFIFNTKTGLDKTLNSVWFLLKIILLSANLLFMEVLRLKSFVKYPEQSD